MALRLLSRTITRPRLAQRVPELPTSVGRRHLTNNGFFRVSEEVREALHSNKPVVALETTIYTHGMYLIA
jgi:pseudouridine-5'-phosphate glycosidase/pseudouridine kinase